MRGGANGARIRLEPQRSWAANDPDALDEVLTALEGVQQSFNAAQTDGTRVSLADLIVLGGAAAIETAASRAGHDITVPFTAGRADATQAQTDIEAFAVLEPQADGFRNYYGEGARLSPADALVDKADLLDLTVRETAALVGGLRSLGANAGGSAHGVFTATPGTLGNDFFVNLLDMGTRWQPAAGEAYVFEGFDRVSGEKKWTATEVDLVFGSNAELRAIAEFYAYAGAEERFVADFVDAWTKVMNADRFDLERSGTTLAGRPADARNASPAAGGN
jgi:catalase-peroxidase